MAIFLQWIVPALVLIFSLIATLLLPPTQQTQVIAPLVVGAFIFVLKSFLGIPDARITNLDTVVAHRVDYTTFRASTRGRIINMSSTGSGEIEELTLKILLDDGKYLDVPARRGEPDIIGFRLLPHGRYPDDMLDFELISFPAGFMGTSERQAIIRLKVIGQGQKEYKVKMAK